MLHGAVGVSNTRCPLILYIGVTSALPRRRYEPQHGMIEGFSKQYGIKRLIYFEAFDGPKTAIDREKQLKR